MLQRKQINTYGRHRQRTVLLADCFSTCQTQSPFNSSGCDSLSSDSSHGMCLRKRRQDRIPKAGIEINQLNFEDTDSFTDEIYGSFGKENRKDFDRKNGREKNKTEKAGNTKKNKKQNSVKAEKPSSGCAKNHGTAKQASRNGKKNPVSAPDVSVVSGGINFSEIEEHSLLVSESPPIENELELVDATPKRTNRNSQSEDRQPEKQLGASPVPVLCSTPNVQALQLSNSHQTETTQAQVALDFSENISLINHYVSLIQTSVADGSLQSSRNLSKDGENVSCISRQSFTSHSDASMLVSDQSMNRPSSQDMSLGHGQRSFVEAASDALEKHPCGKSSSLNLRSLPYAGHSSLELFSTSIREQSMRGQLRSADVQSLPAQIGILVEENASALVYEVDGEEPDAGDIEETDESDADGDAEDSDSSACLSRIVEENEDEVVVNNNSQNQPMDVLHNNESSSDETQLLTDCSALLVDQDEGSKRLDVLCGMVTPEMSCLDHCYASSVDRLSTCAGSCLGNGFVTPSFKMPKAVQEALQKSTRSVVDVLTPMKLPKLDRVPTFAEKVLFQCEQMEPHSFLSVFPARILKSCVKIGEGVYGEVFRIKLKGEYLALKIIPIEGMQLVNGEKQKTFEEILPEIAITKELSLLRDSTMNRTENFVCVKSVSLVQGVYPKSLLDQWEKYNSEIGSDNNCPDMFSESQLFIVFAFEDSGTSLESFQLSNAEEVRSIISQVSMSLAASEMLLEFEHRDLHWGNVLIRPTKDTHITYILDGETKVVPTSGLKVTIIDFTLSRLRIDACIVFNNLACDETLFTGQGDYQFEIYRQMREETKNKWEPHHPFTNVLWIHYLTDKLVNKKNYKNGKNVQALRQSRTLLRNILSYDSAADLVSQCEYFASK